MGRCCSVFGCKSNYRSQKEKVSAFSLPHPIKKKELRAKWLRKIPTDLTKVKEPWVCIKHFAENCIIRTEKFMVNGEVKIYERTYPKLTSDAVPSIFPNLPDRFSEKPSSSRRLCDVEEERFEQAVSESLNELRNYEERNMVKGISDVLEHFNLCQNDFNLQWTCVQGEGKLVFCVINITQDIPYVSGSVTVGNDLKVSVCIDKVYVPQSKLPKHLHTISTKSGFEEVLRFFETQCSCEESQQVCAVEQAVNLLTGNVSCDESTYLQFLIEQIKFLVIPRNNRRYSGSTLILAAVLYMHSPAAYNALYKGKLIYLPHSRNLRKLICKFDVNSFDVDGSLLYLDSKKKFLNENELIVNLVLDEVYIDPQLHFKGGTVYGMSSEANPTGNLEVAKTAQVFMISSVFSQYKDVVSIVPVRNLTSEYLKTMILKVVKVLEEIGFIVLSLVSDNNIVNKKAFELLSPERILHPSIQHPSDANRKLFLVFDTVHSLKSIRNNWIDKEKRVLNYPKFENFDEIDRAEFKFLEMLYEKEKDSLAKYGYLLSHKVLFPSNIQKQNVNLALKIFDERNIAALKCMTSKCEDFAECKGTSSFLDVICKWWHIVNVKHCFEGHRFNCEYRESIRRDSVIQIEFLSRMSLWLKNWRQSVSRSQSLSSQTFNSLINTIDAFLMIIPYVFERYPVDYILLSKWQSDNLEGRFSSYRQLSGANYYISFIQLLEGERKLRFKSTVLLCANRGIPLKTLLPCADSLNDNINIDLYSGVLDCQFHLCDIPEEIIPIIVYISGYSVSKEVFIKKCGICKEWVQGDKEVDVCIPSDYLTEFDRGKLTMPTNDAVAVTGIVWFLLNKIMATHSDMFLGDKKQLSILFKLSCRMIEKFNFEKINLKEMCLCKRTAVTLLENICIRGCRVFINNLIKNRNNDNVQKKFSRQLNKLKG